jgi:hypothetical protein
MTGAGDSIERGRAYIKPRSLHCKPQRARLSGRDDRNPRKTKTKAPARTGLDDSIERARANVTPRSLRCEPQRARLSGRDDRKIKHSARLPAAGRPRKAAPTRKHPKRKPGNSTTKREPGNGRSKNATSDPNGSRRGRCLCGLRWRLLRWLLRSRATCPWKEPATGDGDGRSNRRAICAIG